jgi:hypothetical protein
MDDNNSKGGSLEERGQHRSTEGAPGDTGQKHIVPNPKLGREAVPASKPGADIETERKS